MLRRRAPVVTGYLVPSRAAVETLAQTQPAAAAWWRQNVPHVLKPEQHFVFDAPACEVAEAVSRPH